MRERLARDLPGALGASVDVVDHDLNTAGSCRFTATVRRRADLALPRHDPALALGVPPVVIGWSHKYAEVLAEFGIERFAVDFADPHADIPALVRALLDDRAALSAQITAALEPVQASAAAQFASLDALLT